MLKIGITFDPPDSPHGMFNNGIRQNAFFLLELLLNCGYDVRLIVSGNYDKIKDLNDFYGKEYKFEKYEDILSSNFDIVIEVIFQIDTNVIVNLKKNGSKIIVYFCGNEYLGVMKKILFGGKSFTELPNTNDKIYDQVWTIPQHINTNYYYWKTLFRTEVVEVPFIWSPMMLEESERNNKGDHFFYKKRGHKKKVAIFEPNIDVVKWFLPPLLICENTYRNDKNLDFVYITNVSDKKYPFNIDLVNDIVKSLDLYVDSKVSIEGRYNSLYFMSKYSDIVVSHQWENPLNYLYLDLAWYGWPIIHNAHLCSDIGYYYEGFNYEQGGKVLSEVIKNHDGNYQEYIKKNRILIDRYLPTNSTLQNKYKELIKNLINLK